MHHRDIAGIRTVGYIVSAVLQLSHFSQMGDVSDISPLLAIHKPRIVVDKDGGELLSALLFGGMCLISLSGGDCLSGCYTLTPACHCGFTTQCALRWERYARFCCSPLSLKRGALTVFTNRQFFVTMLMVVTLIAHRPSSRLFLSSPTMPFLLSSTSTPTNPEHHSPLATATTNLGPFPQRP